MEQQPAINLSENSKKTAKVPDMFYYIQQYFTQQAFRHVIENYTISSDKTENVNLAYLMGNYNGYTEASQFKSKSKSKSRSKTKEPKVLTEEQKKEKEKNRCICGKAPDAKGVIYQCKMSKMKNPGENDDPNMCSNHNRQRENGTVVIIFDPELHGEDHPNFKKPTKKRKNNTENKKDDDVQNLINELNEQESQKSEDSNVDDFIHKETNELEKVMSSNKVKGCQFEYSRKTKDHSPGDICGDPNCKRASHKIANASPVNIPTNSRRKPDFDYTKEIKVTILDNEEDGFVTEENEVFVYIEDETTGEGDYEMVGTYTDGEFVLE